MNRYTIESLSTTLDITLSNTGKHKQIYATTDIGNNHLIILRIIECKSE